MHIRIEDRKDYYIHIRVRAHTQTQVEKQREREREREKRVLTTTLEEEFLSDKMLMSIGSVF